MVVIFKNWQSPFFQENSFLPKFAEKSPKWTQNKVFWIFWKTVWLVFPGNDLKWHKCYYWYFTTNLISRKILVLELWSIKLKDSLKCNISKTNWLMKFIFGMQRNIEVFYRVMVSFWLCGARHGQTTQNKLLISLQYLKENVKDEVDFLACRKNKGFFKSILSF